MDTVEIIYAIAFVLLILGLFLCGLAYFFEHKSRTR